MTAPNAGPTVAPLSADQIASLNDLLQLDHDAVQAYTLAIRSLVNVGRRETVIRFRGDHERHVADLGALIRRYGGAPIELPHLPTGPLKLAMQRLGTLGGDREILLAFKGNERQARDKYARAAQDAAAFPGDVADALRRGAADEQRHYEWADEQLGTLGAGPETRVGRAAAVVERAHAGTAERIERVTRGGMRGLETARRGVTAGADRVRRGASRVAEYAPPQPSKRQLRVAVAAAGIGFVLGAVIGASRRR